MSGFSDKHFRLIMTGMMSFMILAYLVWLVSIYIRFQQIGESIKEDYRVWLYTQDRESRASE